MKHCKKISKKMIHKLPPFIRGKIVRHLIQIEDLKAGDMVFKVADEIDDFLNALKLVHDVYIREGYVCPDALSDQFRILKNHILEESAVLIGKKGRETAFTMSLFPDSPIGLPMDSIFKEELKPFRSRGRRIAEAGCLVTHPNFRDGTQTIPMHGNKMVLRYAADSLKIDDLVIAVHPKHRWVYEDILLFERIGGPKAYPNVNKNPAIALRLDLNEMRNKYKQCYHNKPQRKNIHHFIFEQESRSIQLPEQGTVVCNRLAQQLNDWGPAAGDRLFKLEKNHIYY